MTTQEELAAAMLENAAGPQTVSVDGQTVTGQDLSKQLEVLKFNGAKAAIRSAGFGVIFGQIKPPGAV